MDDRRDSRFDGWPAHARDWILAQPVWIRDLIAAHRHTDACDWPFSGRAYSGKPGR